MQTLTCFCTGLQPETFNKNLNHGGIKSEVCVDFHPLRTSPPGLRMRPTPSAASLACQRLILINYACDKPRRRPVVSREPIGGGLDLKPHPHAVCVALPSLARAARQGTREGACLAPARPSPEQPIAGESPGTRAGARLLEFNGRVRPISRARLGRGEKAR